MLPSFQQHASLKVFEQKRERHDPSRPALMQPALPSCSALANSRPHLREIPLRGARRHGALALYPSALSGFAPAGSGSYTVNLHKPFRYRDTSLPYHADSRQHFPQSQVAVAHHRATTSRVSLGRILFQKGSQLRLHGPADDSLRALAEYPERTRDSILSAFLTCVICSRAGRSRWASPCPLSGSCSAT